MILNCQEDSSIQACGSVLSLNPHKLRAWWQSLSEMEKEEICMLDSPTIMSDLANTANSALVVCKLNQTYRKKELISWTKFKDDEGAIIGQTFEFNLKGKDLLDDCLAELLSSFYISITKDQQQSGCVSNEDNTSGSYPRSFIGVKKEKLDFILDLLSYIIPNFGEGEKFLFQKADFLELYPFFISNPCQSAPTSGALPPYIQTLLDRLHVVASLLEYQINLAYFEGMTQYPKFQKTVSSDSSEKVNSLSTMSNEHEMEKPKHLRIKTQLENECPVGEHNASSTASGSPRNLTTLNSSQTIIMEEFNQRMPQKSPKDNSFYYMTRELSSPCLPTDIIPKFYEDMIPYNNQPFNQQAPQSLYFGNEEQDQNTFLYEGCFVGDLHISFEAVDAYLIDEDKFLNEEAAREQSRQDEAKRLENAQNDVTSIEGGSDFCEKEDIKTECENDQNEAVDSNAAPFYMPQNMTMNYDQGYQQHQGYYNNTEYYQQPYGQQPPQRMDYNYGSPNMYMAPSNAGNMMMNSNCGYPSDMNGNYMDCNSFQAPTQKYGEYSRNEYESQFSGMNSGNEKPYYYSGRDRSRYDARPKLPPRFQRMKDSSYRT